MIDAIRVEPDSTPRSQSATRATTSALRSKDAAGDLLHGFTERPPEPGIEGLVIA